MKIVKQKVELLHVTKDPEKLIERAGRTCYQSFEKMSEESYRNFIKRIIDSGHESVIEHAYATFRIITDRGISHEIIRHRIASYSQESTRYCAYKNDLEVIVPYGIKEGTEEYEIWYNTVKIIEENYKKLLNKSIKPQNARDILPTCLKTELIMTANFREWRHFIKLRASKAAHPKIREIAYMIWKELNYHASIIFPKNLIEDE